MSQLVLKISLSFLFIFQELHIDTVKFHCLQLFTRCDPKIISVTATCLLCLKIPWYPGNDGDWRHPACVIQRPWRPVKRPLPSHTANAITTRRHDQHRHRRHPRISPPATLPSLSCSPPPVIPFAIPSPSGLWPLSYSRRRCRCRYNESRIEQVPEAKQDTIVDAYKTLTVFSFKSFLTSRDLHFFVCRFINFYTVVINENRDSLCLD